MSILTESDPLPHELPTARLQPKRTVTLTGASLVAAPEAAEGAGAVAPIEADPTTDHRTSSYVTKHRGVE